MSSDSHRITCAQASGQLTRPPHRRPSIASSRPSTPAARTSQLPPDSPTSQVPTPPVSTAIPATIIPRMTTAAPANDKSAKLNVENLKFSGKKVDFRAWKNRISLYMIGNKREFPDDVVRIAFTMSWMTGNAEVWANNKQDEFV